MRCFYCGPTDKELRPYGPGGSEVCFPCSMGTPERQQAAKNAFYALEEAASIDGPVVLGTEAGPL